MRFSQHQSLPQSDPDRQKGRRKARFFRALKGELRAIMNQQNIGISQLAAMIGRNKSTVSRALDASTNVEALTLFEIADSLKREWRVTLVEREADLGCKFNIPYTDQERFKQSWHPIVSSQTTRKESKPSSEGISSFSYVLSSGEVFSSREKERQHA
ncbi:hypothetical protein [Komagataeibacter rhaeticus]|uniref:hypothetical protein n=1 Tax=Komagataeibacter rhaeticus TaxID=215221 RepID=UPI0039ECA89B